MEPQSGPALERQQLVQQYFDESAQTKIQEKYQFSILEENKIWMFPRWGGPRSNPYRLSEIGLKIFKAYSSRTALEVPLVTRELSFLPIRVTVAIAQSLTEPYYIDTYRLILFGENDQTWALMHDVDIEKLYKAVA
jgi:hypothetical protein